MKSVVTLFVKLVIVTSSVLSPLLAFADTPNLPADALQIALIADTPKLTLGFTVRNTSTTDLVRGELGINTNAIYVLYPDGRVDTYSGIAEPPERNVSWAKLKPGESARWELEVESLLAGSNLDGVYRVYWDFGGTRSDEVTLLRRRNRSWRGEPMTRPAKASDEKRESISNAPNEVLQKFYGALDGGGHLAPLIIYPERDLALTAEHWRKRRLSPEGETALSLHERSRAAKEFKDAVRRRWGDDALFPPWPFEANDRLTALAAGDLPVSYGTHFMEAFVTLPVSPHPVHLVRENQKWRVSMENFLSQGRTDPSLLRTIELLRGFTELVNEGRFRTSDEAREKMKAANDSGF